MKSKMASIEELEELASVLRGCRDMLRESGKQHRSRGDDAHGDQATLFAERADRCIRILGIKDCADVKAASR